MEITPGLHQLKTPMVGPALPYVMPYAFIGSEGVSLFDAGFGTPAAIEAMTKELATLGFEPKDIRRLFISHAHPDHIGMASWVKEQSPEAEVLMLEREWQWIQDRWLDNAAWTQLSDQWLVAHGVPVEEIEAAHREGALSPTSPRVESSDADDGEAKPEQPSGSGGRSPFAAIEPDITLQDGEVVEFDDWRLRAVWTPGHTPGHMCMYEPNRKLMFTGDHVLPYISPNVSLHADQEGSSPLEDFRASLEKVGAFDVERALPAHEFTIPDLRARCDVLLHHHDDRLEEVRSAIGDGQASGRDVSQRVLWNTGPFDDFNIFMKRSAVGETLAHLQLLEGIGRVERVEDGDRVVWRQA